MAKRELAELIDALIEQTISRADFEDLVVRLKNDPAAQEYYLEELQLESLLAEGIKNSNYHPFPQVQMPLHGSAGVLGSGWLVALTLLICGLVCGWFFWPVRQPDSVVNHFNTAPTMAETTVAANNDQSENQPHQRPRSQALVQSMARVTNSHRAEWKSSRRIDTGSWLFPGRFELLSGDVEIAFDSGAVVQVSGKSVIQIINANEVRLIEGSLEADVPRQAIGFKVQTPTGVITDLSTAFAVKVSQSGDSDVYVLKGLVEAQPAGLKIDQPFTLAENSAFRLLAGAPPRAVEFAPAKRFEFGSRQNPNQMNYVHFSFEQPEVSEGVVPNTGAGSDPLGGLVVTSEIENSCLPVTGYFDQAMFFSGTGARIETRIKGIDGHLPRTMMCWIRIGPGTENKNAYSVVSWGNPDNNDGKKWQVGWNPNQFDSSGVAGAIRTEFGGGYLIGTTDLRDGKWHHLASVFLGGKNANVATHVRQYVDGKLESVSGCQEMKIRTDSNERKLSLGEYIGNGSDFFRGYKGWLDEFYLFDVALTPKQIVRVMEENRPPAASEIVDAKSKKAQNRDE